MEKKIYSSYDQIDTDLAILRLEKEIHLKKAVIHLKNAQATLSPDKLVTETINSLTGGFSGIITSLSGLILLYLAKRFFRRR